jgi:two-component system sensor histidine kinase HydH
MAWACQLHDALRRSPVRNDTLNSQAMFRATPGLRLFGLRYPIIFIVLGVLASLLIILLMINMPRSTMRGQSGAPLKMVLPEVSTDWLHLVIIAVLLGVTAAAALLTAYSYFATKQKLAELQRTAAKAILESLVGGVLALDTNGCATTINKAASEILELSAEPPYPTVAELSKKHPALGEIIRQALEHRTYVQDHDSVFVNSMRGRILLRTTVSEQLDKTGRPAGIIVLVKDVSRLVAMEEELRKQDRLAAAGTLAAGVAHEIRNPLSALELNLRLLRDEITDSQALQDDVNGYFEILFAETRRLNRITSNFLRLSRSEPLSKSPLSLHDPLRQVIRLLEMEAREKGVAFELDLTQCDVTVLGDKTKLEQVCLNILINAMEAMPNGGVIRIVTVVARHEETSSVTLSFADLGVGIPPENVPRLFDPYFTTRSEGTGLGLAIADRIVTDHGGKLSVESVLGIGTTMTLTLPLTNGAADKTITQEASK